MSEFAGIDREIISLLERLGLNLLQDVCKLSESVLAGRFGELGVELHRLARGDEQHPLAVVAPPPEQLCSRAFEEPIVDRQTLLNNVQTMADEQGRYFAEQGAICVRLILVFVSETGERCERLWYRPHGLTAASIVESAKWQIESWQIKAPISGLQLIADEVRTDTARQLKLWGGATQSDETAAQAVGRLTELPPAPTFGVACFSTPSGKRTQRLDRARSHHFSSTGHGPAQETILCLASPFNRYAGSALSSWRALTRNKFWFLSTTCTSGGSANTTLGDGVGNEPRQNFGCGGDCTESFFACV
ncbi:MAG: hypothetical protein ACKOFM_01145, partial [Actinomycetota bacterium]